MIRTHHGNGSIVTITGLCAALLTAACSAAPANQDNGEGRPLQATNGAMVKAVQRDDGVTEIRETEPPKTTGSSLFGMDRRGKSVG